MAKLVTHQKKYGSFYTPTTIAKFIVNRVVAFSDFDDTTILEPSCGDGVFIEQLIQSQLFNKELTIDMVEINADATLKLTEKFSKIHNINIINKDFLEFQDLNTSKYSIVIGNPPYIKKSLLTKTQIALSQKLFENHNTLSPSSFKNIWSSFLVRSFDFLRDDGILAFVLPAELLQVDYAAQLRNKLINDFSRVEVFTFNELLFKECKGQDTIILIAYKKSKNPGLFFANIENIENINNFNFTQHDINEKKWSSHSLTNNELELINRLIKECIKIEDICFSKPGIVTAANHFFILNKEDVKKYNVQKYMKKIIQKGSLIGEKITFNNNDFKEISTLNLPCYFIDLNSIEATNDPNILSYLQLGLDENLNDRYKMQSRLYWYQVPYKAVPTPLFFFKRCHNYPKLIRNYSNAISTDSAYMVTPQKEYDANSILFSFYNSFTLACAELMGRYYGGGVLELTPNEFKALPLPYTLLTENEFKKYLNSYSKSKDIKNLMEKYNNKILKSYFKDITDEEIKILENIRLKLVKRRQRL